MLTTACLTWLIGGRVTTRAAIVVVGVAMGASLSTTLPPLALAAAPVLVIPLLGASARRPPWRRFSVLSTGGHQAMTIEPIRR